MSNKPKITFKKKGASNEKKLANLKLRKKIEEEDSGNPNKRITDVLTKLVKQISEENKTIADKDLKKKNLFRIKSFYKAIMIW